MTETLRHEYLQRVASASAWVGRGFRFGYQSVVSSKRMLSLIITSELLIVPVGTQVAKTMAHGNRC